MDSEVVGTSFSSPGVTHAASGNLHRTLDWRGAFWAASGVPAGVLLTIGGIATTIGQPAWVVWIMSIMMGFVQSFTYAEIAGLFPHKSGGASVYGASAWVGYSKFIAPISVWCNWLAWSPVLALGTGLAAGYIMLSLFPANAAIQTWHLNLADLGWIHQGLTIRINAVFIIAALLLLLTFFLQHHGAAKAARKQKILGIACLFPLVIVGLVPIITGDMPSDHFFPLLPMVRDAAGHIGFGTWNIAGLTLMMGAMFAANWSTFGFETAVCYTREFKNPGSDTFKAILSSGVLCIVMFTIVPLAFQGSLGLDALLDPSIYDGTGVALAMAKMVKGGAIVTNLIIVMLLLSLLLIVMTSMMGSSRTLYQASVDGWLPRYLSKVNEHGSPTSAMWTDLVFNIFLLMLSDYFTVLTISNVCYLLFNFLNLQAGWIHRMDRSDWPRPFRCPTWLLALGGVFGFVNMVFVGAGADVWGEGTLRNGLFAAALILPVFIFRHYVQDKGVFPQHMRDDGAPQGVTTRLRAGILPYLALLACAAVIWISHYFAQFHYS
ncbi:APC family permease [Solimicrobium silvestre]|uniref:Amino acid permease n=1 Tax=Solimicrobium silvestre TaxID=2099400 RepID=A0A2S9GWB7_9BURK|nr:APC family permease [Solimicrobium silvestre]PRC91988.1 Amino acid permease [Solimicrobium silvestre]